MFMRCIAGLLILLLSFSLSAESYRELVWDDLIPDGWNPEKELGDINWDELGGA